MVLVLLLRARSISKFLIPVLFRSTTMLKIGAGNTIDRATFGKTWIQSGVKTDNLVQIGHNVTVGENSLLVGQVGISGECQDREKCYSGRTGRHCPAISASGNNAIVGPQAGVAKSVPDGETGVRIFCNASSTMAKSAKNSSQASRAWKETFRG